MQSRLAWVAVAMSGFITVAMGAFGAHGLAELVPPASLRAFETGVRYQAWHTLACLVILVWRQQLPLAGQRLVLWCWTLGIVLFSGSLYLLVLTGWLVLGPVTPIGGLMLLVGWLALAVCALRARPINRRQE
ncbi:DUF423 domain-containing protein [Billgrantia sp. LNSP4103-1]|uniref:DUF423 domain-containing protein n=1 Tax=Billgrantia sp. LNSP4103-1 TaxID=3410266 RepID=UPI00403F54B8